MIDNAPRPIYPSRAEIDNAPFETLADWLGTLPKAENETEATLKLWVLERYLSAVLERLNAEPPQSEFKTMWYVYLGATVIGAGACLILGGVT